MRRAIAWPDSDLMDQQANDLALLPAVNYHQRIPDHRTPIKSLYLANTTQIYPEDRGTNYSVRMGRRVSQMVVEDARTA